MERQYRIQAWLESLFPGQAIRLAPASADASFRRYFRAVLSNGDHYIVMDAPPQYEDCRPFIEVAALFGAAGANTPKVLAQDLAQGFLLLTDLGDVTYLSVLNADNAGALYSDALDALLNIQRASRPGVLPDYDRALLERELRLFPEWYIARHLGVELNAGQAQTLETVFETILANNLAQAKVFVHRDYHSRNLMLHDGSLYIIDFQDARMGPDTYDLVSLLRDSYVDLTPQQVDELIAFFLALNGQSTHDQEFRRRFDLMSLQRNLKALGTFGYQTTTRGNPVYMQYVPRTLTYVRRTLDRDPRFARLGELLGGLVDELRYNSRPS